MNKAESAVPESGKPETKEQQTHGYQACCLCVPELEAGSGSNSDKPLFNGCCCQTEAETTV